MTEFRNFSMCYTILTISRSEGRNRIAIKSAHINFLTREPRQDQYIAEQGNRYQCQHGCSNGSCSMVRKGYLKRLTTAASVQVSSPSPKPSSSMQHTREDMYRL